MLKPVRMADQAVCVTRFDSGIDHENSDWAAYGAVAFDNPSAWRDFIKAKDGETITEFVIGVVPTEFAIRIEDECLGFREGLRIVERPDERMWRYFLHGLRDIKHWSDGEVPKKDFNGVEYVDPTWIKKTFVKHLREVALDIGRYVWAFNQLTEKEIKN